MPAISKRGIQMPESPIRKLVPFAEDAKKRGVKVIHLNIGQPDILTPEIGWKALRESDMKVLAYSHSAGNESYRKKLLEYYASQNINIDLENIMVTTGGSEALYFGMFSCLDPGDEVIIPEPFYANYNGFATAGSIKVKPITASIQNGFALPPIQEFEKQINENTKAILICNPNNPTGYLYSRDELEILREMVLKHNLFLFADEVYREFAYDGKKHTSIMHLEGLDEHAVVVDSISKRYSACGARIGALISRNKEIMATALKFGQARLSPPSLAQIVGEAMVDVEQSYFDDVLQEYTNRRNTLVEGLRKIEGVTCPNPGGAFYTTVELPIEDSDHFCRWMLESYSHEGQTVMMAPGTGFYASEGLGKKEVRIAYVLNEDELKKAIEILGQALSDYEGSS